jgi:catechol 2,3-dioxygenase
MTCHDFMTFGPVHLDVVNVRRSLRFWCDVIGLCPWPTNAGACELGTQREVLLVLHPGAKRPSSGSHTGLYRVALHLPDRSEFARMLARLMAHQWPMAPTDHVASLAIYLRDPDGIGVELTLNTTERVRSQRVTCAAVETIDADGCIRSGRDPIDVSTFLAEVPIGDIECPLPCATTLGHVHLHVSDIVQALRFYRGGLGFVPALCAPHFGFADLSAGGRWPRRLSFNTWHGYGATPPPAGTAGLRYFTIRFDTPERLALVVHGLPQADQGPEGYRLCDPSGNAMLLTV